MHDELSWLDFVTTKWATLPVFWQTFIVVTLSVFAVVWYVKGIFRLNDMPSTRRKPYIYLTVLLVSVSVTTLGRFIAPEVKLPLWQWWFMGITSGVSAMMIHKYGVKIIGIWFPRVAAAIKGGKSRKR